MMSVKVLDSASYTIGVAIAHARKVQDLFWGYLPETSISSLTPHEVHYILCELSTAHKELGELLERLRQEGFTL